MTCCPESRPVRFRARQLASGRCPWPRRQPWSGPVDARWNWWQSACWARSLSTTAPRGCHHLIRTGAWQRCSRLSWRPSPGRRTTLTSSLGPRASISSDRTLDRNGYSERLLRQCWAAVLGHHPGGVHRVLHGLGHAQAAVEGAQDADGQVDRAATEALGVAELATDDGELAQRRVCCRCWSPASRNPSTVDSSSGNSDTNP